MTGKNVCFAKETPAAVLEYAYVMHEADKVMQADRLNKAQRLEVYSGCMDAFRSLGKKRDSTVLAQLPDERARLAVRMYWRRNEARFAKQNEVQYTQGKTVVDKLLDSMLRVE